MQAKGNIATYTSCSKTSDGYKPKCCRKRINDLNLGTVWKQVLSKVHVIQK